MFYFKSTVDKKIKSLDRKICELENRNRKLERSLERQGIEPDYYVPSHKLKNLKTLNSDFKKLLEKLDLRIVHREPSREIIEIKEDGD